jgi:opacity protein-like surface antigen
MRSTLVAVMLVLMATSVAWAQPPAGDMLSSKLLLARVDYQLSTDSAFTDVYDKGPIFGGELRIPLGQTRLAIFAEGSYLTRAGKLTYTQEDTDLTISTAEAGVLYRIGRGAVTPYVGAGVAMFMFKETSDALGEASQSKAGFTVVGGVSMALGRHFALDGRLKYNNSSMKPADVDIKVGGLSAGVGIGLRF